MSHEVFLKGKVQLCCGDSLHFLKDQPDNRYDSIVTDPPYGLQFMGAEWDKLWRNRTDADKAWQDAHDDKLGGRARKLPDYATLQKGEQMQAAHREWALEACRVLKPGGHIVAFAATRTYHRLACAIEDAGFEVRDQIGWCFGSGFPKSHNAGNGWGTALKPAWEPICLARKPLIGTVAANVLQHGVGAINVDGCRIGTDDTRNIKRGGKNDFPNEDDAWEPRSVTVGSACGRWPANIIHDGSDEVIAAFPEASGQQAAVSGFEPSSKTNAVYGQFNGRPATEPRGDSGSAARFFYTAKADADDRLGSKHPTVKPVDLMQWLVRLVTPKGGLVLDPFAGTGTTAEACYREGMRCMLVERETEYQADIRRRMALVLGGPEERRRESIKAKAKDQPVDPGPLFSLALDSQTS